MQSITLAQLEPAIHYWRKYHERERYHNSADGACQERTLTDLYARMIKLRLGAIDLNQTTSEALVALECLYGGAAAHTEDNVALHQTDG
jgi:hypothetical protein